MDSQSVVLAHVTRGGRIESEHFGQIVLCDAEGNVERSFGDPDVATYMRSSAKLMQATTCIRLGAADKFSWTDDEVAVVCASHTARPEHLERVRSLLQRADLTPDDLGCGPHPPIDHDVADELVRAGKKPERIHNNCSGKHTGMLSTCRAMGWDVKTYLKLEHPLQQANLETVSVMTGLAPTELTTGVDGCGVPSFYAPLRALAVSFARLGKPEMLPDSYVEPVRRVAHAVGAYPELVAGKGKFTAKLGRHSGPRLVMKSGAEGVIGICIPEVGLGLAVKCSDGASRPHPAIVCRLLSDLLPDLPWDQIRADVMEPIRNTRDEIVGDIRPAF